MIGENTNIGGREITNLLNPLTVLNPLNLWKLSQGLKIFNPYETSFLFTFAHKS
jgi:hypothetical protein